MVVVGGRKDCRVAEEDGSREEDDGGGGGGGGNGVDEMMAEVERLS